MAPGQHLGASVAFVDGFDPAAPRASPAGFDDGAHRLGRTGEHRLDRAVAAVAHPALDAMHRCRVLDEHAKADALHPSAHAHMTNGVAHPISPVATPRVPRKPGTHRLSPAT